MLALAAAYSGSLRVPFLLDDESSILTNRSLDGLVSALSPGPGMPTSGRPLLNLTFAANRAAGGVDVSGYHAVNLAIHMGSALLLFGLVRRTLCRPPLQERFGKDADALAAACAAVWALNPILTESVTYVSQRAESLMGMLCLATLYLFARGASGSRPAPWLAASAGACLLAALTKEVAVTAPLLVLLYDRSFFAGSFRAALRRRRFYGALALSWAALLLLAASHGQRGVGFGYDVGPAKYAVASLRSLGIYLRLCVWPSPLVFDYGPTLFLGLRHVGVQAAAVVILSACTVWGLARRHPAGFAGAWFLLILAPTTSFVPVALQPTAENRLYLPLASACAAFVLVAYRVAGPRVLWLAAVASAALGFATFERNLDYGSEARLWADTIAKAPLNPRAHCSYGYALARAGGDPDSVIREYQRAIELDPGYVEAHDKLGVQLAQMPRGLNDAIVQFREALRRNPGYLPSHVNLAIALSRTHAASAEAVFHFREAVRLAPGSAHTHGDLGLALAKTPGGRAEGLEQLREAIRIDPSDPEAHNALGTVLAQDPASAGEARVEYEAALRLDPSSATAHDNLGLLLARQGDLAQAASQFQVAAHLAPDSADAHAFLGHALLSLPGRTADAVGELQLALRLRPDDADSHNNLGIALANTPGRLAEAQREFESALRLRPDFPDAQRNLATILAMRAGSAH